MGVDPVIRLLLVTAVAAAAPLSTDQPRADRARLPPFAAILAQRPPIRGPAGWTVIDDRAAWNAIAHATPATRQAARWAYADSLIASSRYAEALGVLQIMVADDPDLALIGSFNLAVGVAQQGLNRPAAAISALGMSELAENPEACAWRIRALSAMGDNGRAVANANCALPAINARAPGDRQPFVIAAADAATAAGYPDQALRWLRAVDDRDAGANLSRARAHLALKQPELAHLRFQRAGIGGTPEQQAAAKLGVVECGLATRQISPAAAIGQLDSIRFGWRGGAVERRALDIGFGLVDAQRDPTAKLRIGSTLLRYFDAGPATGAITAQLQQTLATALAPGSKTPLPDMAGLFWDYRELAPAGVEGDLMVRHLADRLAAAGLYARAADLLGYQLAERTLDVAKGPLSVEVATLQILAGAPDRAIDAIRGSEGPTYPPDMAWSRKRIEAVALAQLGKVAAALAALQDVPGSDAVRAEILWKQHDWREIAAMPGGPAPGSRGLSDADQTVVLRRAIALAMLGREDDLRVLRGRYLARFRGLPTQAGFDLLTRDVTNIEPASITAAMASIPSASPAGRLGDLLYVGSGQD